MPHLLARHPAGDGNLRRRLALRLWLSELGAGERARRRRIKRLKQRVRKARKRSKVRVRRYRKHVGAAYGKRLVPALRRARRRALRVAVRRRS